jgi:hypothetical protein
VLKKKTGKSMNFASTELDSLTDIFTVAIVGFDMTWIMRIRDFDIRPDSPNWPVNSPVVV